MCHQELQARYCGSIGYEYMHLLSQDQKEWFMENIEHEAHSDRKMTPGEKRNAHAVLQMAEVIYYLYCLITNKEKKESMHMNDSKKCYWQ